MKSLDKSDDRLLQPRKRTAAMLGVSLGTVIRYERRGLLSPIKLTEGGMVLHRVAEVEALADPQRVVVDAQNDTAHAVI